MRFFTLIPWFFFSPPAPRGHRHRHCRTGRGRSSNNWGGEAGRWQPTQAELQSLPK